MKYITNHHKLYNLLTLVALVVVVVLLPIVGISLWKGRTAVRAVELKLDESQGTTINDNDRLVSGTITNAVWKTKDVCLDNSCLYFDGTGDYVSFGDDADLDFIAADTFTISLWFRHGPISSGTQVLVAKYLASTGTDGGYKIQMESDGDITFGIDDDQTSFPEDYVTSTAATYDDNKWHHVAAVKNGTTSISLYIDGRLIGTNASTTADNTLANTDAFYIGMDGDGSSNGFVGYIDEVKIARSAYTAAQVDMEMVKGSSLGGAAAQFGRSSTETFSDGLVGYWKMDETSGNATDYSGNSQTLTDVNTVVRASGKYGNGSDFESTNSEAMHISDMAPLSVTGSLTVSGWIKPESNSAATTYAIAGKWDGTNESYLLTQYGDEIRMYIDSSGNYVTTNATNLATGTWYFVAGTYNAESQSVKIYVNGVEQAATTTGTIPSSIGDDTGHFYIGAYGTAQTLTLQPDATDGIDTQTLASSPTNNYETQAFISFRGGDSGRRDGLLKFNLTSVSGFATTARTLSLWSYNAPAGDSLISINRILSANSAWTEAGASHDYAVNSTTRWAGDTGGDGGTDAACSVSGTDFSSSALGSFTIVNSEANDTQHDVSLDQTEFETMSSANYGMVLTSSSTTLTSGVRSSDYATAGNRPKLVVNYNGPSNYYDGIIDDVRVYNRNLSPSEITQLMSNASSPVGWWKMDENTGTSAYDSTGNGLTGTLTNGPQWMQGKYGSGIASDGNQKYISVANNAMLNPAGDFTLSGWVKSVQNTVGEITRTENMALVQKEDGVDGYQLGITQDNKPFFTLANQGTKNTVTKYDNGGSADCGQSEGNDDGCVFDTTSAGHWDYPAIGGSSVMKDGNTYKMWYTGNNGTSRIGYATSTDGISWTRYDNGGSAACGFSEANDDGCVFSVGAASSWDVTGVSYPRVMKDGDTYKMWYSGTNSTTTNIGYATSSDGITWTRYDNSGSADCGYSEANDDGCVFARNSGNVNAWDTTTLTSGTVIKDVTTYKMWYEGVYGTVSRIGYATSTDGVTWTRYDDGGSAACGFSEVDDDGCVFERSTGTLWDHWEVNDPYVYKDGNIFKMLYSASNETNVRLGYTYSTDGVSWTRYDDTATAACSQTEADDNGCTLDIGASGSWDDFYVNSPSIIREGNTYKVWYTGFDGVATARIGYATSSDGILSSTALTNNTFHFLSAVKQNSTLTLSVDGNVVTSGSTSVTTLSNTSSLLLGNWVSGAIDDFKIYNYARTSAQIIEDMNGGHPAPGSPVGSAVAHWKFDDAAGTTANDSTANNNDLTLNTAMWTPNGKFGYAWHGTGGNVRASRTTDPDLEFSATDDFSLSVWFKSNISTNPAANEYLINDGAAAGAAGYAVYANTSGNLCFGIDDDTSWGPDVASCTATDIYDGTWHHVAAVRNTTSDTTSLYVDGVLKDSDNDTTTATLDSSPTFYIGDIDTDDAGSGEEFAGDIDEMKVFRSALTADQVKQLYSQSATTVLGSLSDTSGLSGGSVASNSAASSICVPGETSTCAGPIAYWPLDENTGTTARNKSGKVYGGNESDLTVGNNTKWVSGVKGSALKQSGESSANATLLTQTNQVNLTNESFTLSAWVYLDDYDYGFNIMEKKLNANDSSAGYALYVWRSSDDGNACIYLGDGVDMYETCTAAQKFLINHWYHIVGLIDRNSQARSGVYINGILDKTFETGTIASIGSISNSEYFDILRNSATPYTLNARVDELKIFDYALSNSQIMWDYNRGAPVAQYKFDECTGATAYNSSKNSFGQAAGNNATITIGGTGTYTATGTCSGAATDAWKGGASGKFSSSIALDGSNDYIRTSAFTPLGLAGNTTTNISWGGWYYPTSFAAAATPVDKATEFRTTIDTSGNAKCGIYYSAAYHDGAAAALTVSAWNHVMCVYDGITLKTYVNGILKDSTAYTTAITAASSILYLGQNSSAAQFFPGKIDDVRIYNYALTAQQIKMIINDESAVRWGP